MQIPYSNIFEIPKKSIDSLLSGNTGKVFRDLCRHAGATLVESIEVQPPFFGHLTLRAPLKI
ncbi:hypothetical protein NTGM5_30092 [Candidatus Nitrotoga sp. M5]|nr:hypothetical protein NTGM5_30092 [Candidatus Nitrotoga sp. M5]